MPSCFHRLIHLQTVDGLTPASLAIVLAEIPLIHKDTNVLLSNRLVGREGWRFIVHSTRPTGFLGASWWLKCLLILLHCERKFFHELRVMKNQKHDYTIIIMFASYFHSAHMFRYHCLKLCLKSYLRFIWNIFIS